MLKTKDIFLQLIRAGLWEKAEGHLPEITDVQWRDILALAKEQTVPGLLSEGIRRYGAEPPSDVSLNLLQEEVQIEGKNARMDEFVAKLFAFLKQSGIPGVLVKGQSVALYYEHPKWRCPGDVDLLLTVDDYEKMKVLMAPKASSVGTEDKILLQSVMYFGSIELELHGAQRSRLSGRIDRYLDALCKDIFDKSRWQLQEIASAQVPSPVPDDYIFILFMHILQHFFQEGVGLRQVCDWCRILWACSGEFDLALLRQRLEDNGLMGEWQAFAALAVGYLGMPQEAMPFYRAGMERKASLILRYIFATGNFGKNRDLDKMHRLPFLLRKISLFTRKTADFLWYRLVAFPLDGTRFMLHAMWVSVRHTISEL